MRARGQVYASRRAPRGPVRTACTLQLATPRGALTPSGELRGRVPSRGLLCVEKNASTHRGRVATRGFACRGVSLGGRGARTFSRERVWPGVRDRKWPRPRRREAGSVGERRLCRNGARGQFSGRRYAGRHLRSRRQCLGVDRARSPSIRGSGCVRRAGQRSSRFAWWEFLHGQRRELLEQRSE